MSGGVPVTVSVARMPGTTEASDVSSDSRAASRACMFIRACSGQLVTGLMVILILSVAGCAASLALQRPAFDMTGVWKGQLRVVPCSPSYTEVGRCNAVNNITFSLRQTGNKLSGDYSCQFGTYVCRDANTTDRGTIMYGWLSGRAVTLRVMIPGDVSSCLFTGRASEEQVVGGYACYQGGALVEIGNWQVKIVKPGVASFRTSNLARGSNQRGERCLYD
jgi:hypothetical protein